MKAATLRIEGVRHKMAEGKVIDERVYGSGIYATLTQQGAVLEEV